MKIIEFKQLDSFYAISSNFGVKKSFIESVISTPDDFYEELRIPKKGRNKSDYRVVYKAESQLARLHSEIKSHLEYNIYDKNKFANKQYISKYSYGFIRGKGTKHNALNHLNKKKLLNIDIKNFFKSIKIEDVYHVLINYGIPIKGAEILSKIITYNGVLEEGLHCSPMISNLYCYKLDLELYEVGRRYRCSYSRYADDISFSSNGFLPKLGLLTKILRKYNFVLNPKKTRFAKKGKAQYVTGLSVSDNKYPRIPRPVKAKLRQELYYIEKYGIESHFQKIGVDEEEIAEELSRIAGWIRYMISIEPDLGNKYLKILDHLIYQ